MDSKGLPVLAVALGRRGGCVKYGFEVLRRWPSDEYVAWVSAYCDEVVPIAHRRIRTYAGRASFVWNSIWVLVPLLMAIAYRGRHTYRAVYFPYFHYWTWPLSLAARFAGLPVILTVHDGLLHAGDGLPLEQSLNNLSVALASRVIYLSDYVLARTAALRKPGTPNTVVPHGVFDLGLNIERRKLPHDRPPRLLFFGRINPYKGLELLFSAFTRIQARQRVDLTVAGRPAYDFAKPSGIDYRLGFLSDDDVARLFATHDILVMPYLEATQSGVITQAIAAAMPVVVTRVGGLNEQLIDGKEAVFVDPTVDGIESGIRALIDDREHYEEISEALTRKRDVSSWEKIADRVRHFVLHGEEEPQETYSSPRS